MAHALRALIGSYRALSPYQAITQNARFYSTRPGARLFVLPIDDDLHDELHTAYGTGEWLDNGIQLSSGDIAFAARASEGTALAFVETEYFGGTGAQSAALWENGAIRLGPVSMESEEARKRPQSLWPINAVLRALGVEAKGPNDEFEVFGLAEYRSNEAIKKSAFEVTSYV